MENLEPPPSNKENNSPTYNLLQFCSPILNLLGDSGGPLMLPIRSGAQFPFHQIGIVSNGYSCALSNMPALYTRISHYSDWIEEKLAINITAS